MCPESFEMNEPKQKFINILCKKTQKNKNGFPMSHGQRHPVHQSKLQRTILSLKKTKHLKDSS